MENMADKIHEIFMNCLPGTIPEYSKELQDRVMLDKSDVVEVDNLIFVKGITVTVAFKKETLNESKKSIEDVLNELPDNFKMKSGGGHSFLNACIDRNDFHWAEQITVEQLMMLGMAIGKIKYCLEREFWSALPGG